MNVNYEWTLTNVVTIGILTHADGAVDGESSVDEGNVALEIAGDNAFIIESPDHDTLLALIERMRDQVQQHKDLTTIPVFSSPEEADAWLEARAAQMGKVIAANDRSQDDDLYHADGTDCAGEGRCAWWGTSAHLLRHAYVNDPTGADYCSDCNLPPGNQVHEF